MSSGDRRPRLRGRRMECQALDRVVARVRGGQSRVLVVRGEAGVGKTALLDHLVDHAPGCRIARAAGVASEMGLAFAGVHQLGAPFLDRLEHLPGPQREALGTAFGLRGGEPPDRFLVALAVLGLLTEVAEKEPLICLVDDAQWLDRQSAQTLAFVARRLLTERVALVFAEREHSDKQELADLPELLVGGLGDGDARALLDSVIRGPVDARVRDRIVAETRGNPRALLELPRAWTAAELAGGFGLPEARPVVARVEQSYVRRLRSLPAQTQRLVVAAAAEPLGEVTLLWRAADRLGIGPDAAAPAEAAGLIAIGARVEFPHPLVRSAAYRAASAHERRFVHRALAEATDPALDPDRRTWHRAHAATRPDEDVASELEDSAGRAQARGGMAAAAAFLQRATHLTPDPARRAERALVAAQALHEAGAPDAALELLATAPAGALDELQLARAELQRAQIAFASRRGSDAPPLLVKAARRLEPLDVKRARETHLDALMAAIFAGRLGRGGGLRGVAEAARAAPASQRPPEVADLLLDGLAALATNGYAEGAPLVKRALAAVRAADSTGPGADIRWLSVASHAAMDLWDDDAWETFSRRHVELARDAGALAALPVALSTRLEAQIFAGDLIGAEALAEEARSVAEGIGTHLVGDGAVALAGWRGREPEASASIAACIKDVIPRGEGIGLTTSHWARAVLYNGLGRYREALTAAQQAAAHPDELSPTKNWALSELVEAAVRASAPRVAADALEQLAAVTGPSGTDWALGIEARSRALLSDGPAAEALHREAVERLGRTRIRVERDRAHLLYGEWLRRENRRLDAREHLRLAHGAFSRYGAEAFAKRARRELMATGETVRRRTVETVDELTAQEAQIARLAGDGRTNPEIGALLFISPRTVEWHLRKVFTKVGVSSRRELRAALPADGRVAASA